MAHPVAGGIEEVTGLQFSPISTLERQYEAPVGQRIVVFVRANSACCIRGGVESILKLRKAAGGSSANRTVVAPADSSATTPSTDILCGSELDDPFGFLGGQDYNNAPKAANSNPANGIGRFLKKVARNTTQSLERGMQELAIRADQGRNPDLLVCALYSNNNNQTLLGLTDSVPISKGSEDMSFCIPLVLPPRLDDQAQVILKLLICSQANLLSAAGAGSSSTSSNSSAKQSKKYYVMGQTMLHVGQLRQLLQKQKRAFFSVTPFSNILRLQQHLEEQQVLGLQQQQQQYPEHQRRRPPLAAQEPLLSLCVLGDPKMPALGQRAWSLTDPRFSGYASGLYNFPLDMSYSLLWKRQQHYPAPYYVATERATESVVVLPIATAFSLASARATQVSLNHATAMATNLLARRTEEKAPGPKAHVKVDLGWLQINDPSKVYPSQVQLTISWEPPNNIFALELIQMATIPVCRTSLEAQVRSDGFQNNSNPAGGFTFYPPLCTSDILPPIMKAYNGRLPPCGYVLGNLRVRLWTTAASTSTSSGQSSGVDEVLGEAVVVLEQHVGAGPKIVEFQVVGAPNYRNSLGYLALHLDVRWDQAPTPLPKIPSPHRGLVSLVGLEPLLDGLQPNLDFDPNISLLQQSTISTNSSNPIATVTEEERLRRLQLSTMGTLMTHAFLEQRVLPRRQADLAIFQNRAQKYQAALHINNSTDSQLPPSEQKSPKPFRPSCSRPDDLLSAIPFNVHNATLALDVLDPHNQQDPPPGHLFHNITCGAPADHARDYGNIFKSIPCPIPGSVSGGLRRLEQKREEIAKAVHNAQSHLISAVATYLRGQREQGRYLNHIPPRHLELQNLRWKVYEAVQAYTHITWICALRRANVFSQALGIAVSSYLASLSDTGKVQLGWPAIWAQHGYLVSFEGLLSAAGKELGMIEDASVAIEMLRMVKVVLVPDDGSSGDESRVPIPHSPLLKWVHLMESPIIAGGHKTQFLLQIGMHPHYYNQRIPEPLKNGTPVQFHPLLFQVGVDIRQWGAHAGNQIMKGNFGENKPEVSTSGSAKELMGEDEEDDMGIPDDDVLVALNYEALQKMNVYCHALSPVTSMNPADNFPSWKAPQQQQQQQLPVHPSLQMLHSHIVTSAGKMNHNILDEAATMAQQLGGGGVVFCKSGKDRTAMHVTYKQAQFANRYRQEQTPISGHPHQDDDFPMTDTTLDDATRMRIYGTRLPICEKNVGQALYAFNSLQAKFMPEALKPPPSTLAGFLKGGRLLQGGGIET